MLEEYREMSWQMATSCKRKKTAIWGLMLQSDKDLAHVLDYLLQSGSIYLLTTRQHAKDHKPDPASCSILTFLVECQGYTFFGAGMKLLRLDHVARLF